MEQQCWRAEAMTSSHFCQVVGHRQVPGRMLDDESRICRTPLVWSLTGQKNDAVGTSGLIKYMRSQQSVDGGGTRIG
jgi:hypothetical protein